MNDDLISRSALQRDFKVKCIEECWDCPFGIHTDKLIKNAPAVDAVEVVRCKDCEYFGRSPFGYSPTKGWCSVEGCHKRLDYYCASGRRKE